MITVRVDPSIILTANQRLHWAKKSRRTADLRMLAVVAWRKAGTPQHSRLHLLVRIGYPNRRARDAHNLMPTVKALVDGMVHPNPRVRGLLADDSDEFLTGPDLRHDPTLDLPGRFTFVFEEAPRELVQGR